MRNRGQLNSGAHCDVPRAPKDFTRVECTYTKHATTHGGQKLPTSGSLTRYAPDSGPAARTRRAPIEHRNRDAARDATAAMARAQDQRTRTRAAETAPPGGHHGTQEHAHNGPQTTRTGSPAQAPCATRDEHTTAARPRRRWRWRRGGIEDGGESAGGCGDGGGASAEGDGDAGDGEAVRGSRHR